MNTARRPLWFALYLALSVTGCCAPVSKHPLSDEQTSVADPRLVGTWELESQNDDGQPKRMVIRRPGDGSVRQTVLEVTLPDGNGDDSQEPVRLYCTRIQGRAYLSWRERHRSETGPASQYAIVRYEIRSRGKEFWVQIMSCDAVAREIEAGRLKGKVAYEEVVPAEPPAQDATVPPPPSSPMPLGRPESVLITSSTEELRAYFAEHPDACFPAEDCWMMFGRRSEDP